MHWTVRLKSLMEQLTPFIMGGLGLLVTINGWLLTQVVAHGKELVEIKTAFKFYLERTGIDAARILAGSKNPTPEEMKPLLQKYIANELENGEKVQLVEWLEEVRDDETVAKGERSIALQLLASIHTVEQAPKLAKASRW